mmetsp:Transcript_4116/g.25950  ORF Transcript_4116/g.25950 Transcript_4116/m.25950 type:complete len:291 (-) Transcript_4116:3-875(-)
MEGGPIHHPPPSLAALPEMNGPFAVATQKPAFHHWGPIQCEPLFLVPAEHVGRSHVYGTFGFGSILRHFFFNGLDLVSQIPHLHVSGFGPGGYHAGHLLHGSDPIHASAVGHHACMQPWSFFFRIFFVLTIATFHLFIAVVGFLCCFFPMFPLVQVGELGHHQCIFATCIRLRSGHQSHFVREGGPSFPFFVSQHVEAQARPFYTHGMQEVVGGGIVIQLFTIFDGIHSWSPHPCVPVANRVLLILLGAVGRVLLLLLLPSRCFRLLRCAHGVRPRTVAPPMPTPHHSVV